MAYFAHETYESNLDISKAVS